MIRTVLASSLATLPFVYAALPASAPQCPNLIRHEPLVVYDQSGFGIGGQIDLALSVYNDGTARLSSYFAGPPSLSQARLEYVGPDAAQQLFLDLAQLGAGTMCDTDQFATDLPTSTLTLQRGLTDSAAHTSSWLAPDTQQSLVEQRLWAFIQATFPGS